MVLGKKTPTTPAETGPAPRPSGRKAESAGDSVVGRGMTVNGDCVTAGRLRVEGHITGRVEASSLEVAEGGRVDGDAVSADERGGEDAFVIQGVVQGMVRAARVEVSKEGSVLGGIQGREAVVHGKVSGGIVAEQRLVLEESSVIQGDVRARRLALKEGGQVNGDIRMGERAGEPPKLEPKARSTETPPEVQP